MDLSALTALGLLDGLNICSLSVMTLLVSLLYSRNATRNTVLLTGSIYILGVFVSYLLAGFGIFTLTLSVEVVPHLLARISAGALIFFGTANLLNYYRPGTISLHFAPSITGKLLDYVRPATVPTAGVAGMIAGIHNFPCACTGGVYFSFISMIAGSTNAPVYLLIYNMAAVTPLLLILATCSSKQVTLRLRRWHQSNAHRLHLALGVPMLTIGIIVLFLAAFGGYH